ncbi:MAG: ATP-binding protein [Treponema sp.]|nr:ATP-binding protein [Treponema sp.]
MTDITQNGAESGAELVELHISETVDSSGKGKLSFTVVDNGKGMSEEELKKAQDPFVTDGVKHPSRKVGLGLPFLIQTAESSGGEWEVKSEKGVGTKVSAWFDLANVDTPPMGSIPEMFRTVMLFQGPSEVLIKRIKEAENQPPEGRIEYEVLKTELADALGGLEDTQSLILMEQYFRSLEENE